VKKITLFVSFFSTIYDINIGEKNHTFHQFFSTIYDINID